MADDTLTPDQRERANTALDIAQQIEPLLKGLGVEVQGAVLGQLTATWLSGHYSVDPDRQGEVWRDVLWGQDAFILRLAALDRARKRAG